MSRWTRSAETYATGKADVRWDLKTTDIESDPEVKAILADVKLTLSEKEKKISERIDALLDEHATSAEAIVQDSPHSISNHVDPTDIAAVVTAFIAREQDELVNQLATYLGSLGLGDEVIQVVLGVIDKSDRVKKLLKDNNVEVDATIIDILDRYTSLKK